MERLSNKLILKLLIAVSVSIYALYVSTVSASEFVITQKGKRFSKVFLKVENNDIIRFVNDDTVKHQISFSHKGRSHQLDELVPGKAQEISVNKAGLFDITCGYHPDMKLTIFVRPTVKLEKNLSDYIF